MIAKSTSETWYELANDACGEVDLLYRTEIHAVLNEISNICYLRYQHHMNRPTQACVGTTKRAQGWDQWVCGWSNLVQAHQGGHIDRPHTRFEWIQHSLYVFSRSGKLYYR